MKYNDVVMLINGRVSCLTSHSLTVAAAYVVTKFKGELMKLFQEWRKKFDSLTSEAGIDNPEEFDKRRAELTEKLNGHKRLSVGETKELDELNEKFRRLMGLREKLAEDTVKINIKPLAYEDWNNLKNENKELKLSGVELLEMAEPCLENILWAPYPEEPEQE